MFHTLTTSRPAVTRLIAVLLSAAVASALVLVTASRSDAADVPPSILDGGYIISDAAFFDGTSMDAGAVQAFLESKEAGCVPGYTCLKSYTADIPVKAADRYCAALDAASAVSAATIIARAGAACGISPKVLLVMMQKEQGLVTATSPTMAAYGKAMGQACPDTAACDPAFAGFFNQVYGAARQMKVYTLNPTSFGYRAGQVNTIQWYPNKACGVSKVFIQNQATANLYIYTPYRPNVAALAAGYGTGDACSTYGNRNFYNYYVSWFVKASATAPALVPACQTPPDADVVAASGTATVNVSALNARSAPTLVCSTGLFTLGSGSTVTITGTYGMWSKVTAKGRSAWVATEYLTPVAPAPAVQPTPTPSPSPSPAPAPAPVSQKMVTTAAVNLRTGPGATYAIITTVAKGTTVTASGSSGVWRQVTVSGRGGWMSGDYLAAVFTPVQKKTTAALNVRSAASFSGSILFVLPSAAKVTVTGVSGAWSRITYGTRTGWVYSSYLA